MSTTKLQSLPEIPLPDAGAFAISPSGEFAVVCQTSSGKISIIDTRSGKILKTISFPRQPTGVEFSRNGMFLYVVLDRDAIVEFFTSDWCESKRISWTEIWTKIVADNDGGHVYAVSPRGIDELDVARLEIVRSFPYPELMNSSALKSGNLLCLVTLEKFIVFDVQSWGKKREQTIEGGHLVEIDPRGKRAFVGQNRKKIVEILNLESGDSLGSIPGDDFVQGVALTPSGLMAFVISHVDANMAVYDVVGEVKKIEDVSIGGNPKHVVVTRDGARVYVTNGIALKVFEVS
ncbi:YncE family protein [Pseudomonas laurylsulfatiphila]|uniref:YncE family protein n=1 Tax=Pseudomonas laurylsulfatiphila TaxID=2011015 RepID=UPI003D136F03